VTRNNPPFRADQVGSLLRPDAVKEARAKCAAGQLSAAALAEIEDRAVDRLVARQEAVGLRSVTDGELRRAIWHTDFLQGLSGVTIATVEADAFQGQAIQQKRVIKTTRVTGKLDFVGHPMLEHFRYLKGHTGATAKFTIPAPTMLASASKDWREVVDRSVYPTLESMFVDLGFAYRKAVKAFGDAGCRYLQLDDCSMAFLCDPKLRKQMQDRGDDPDAMLNSYVGLINSALADKPADMVVSTHICRGNFRSTWLAQGGYEPVAEALFNRINYNAYFLEYDNDRSGGFEPLRFVPKNSHKLVVLGLVTTKTGQLESRDDIKRRIDEAAAYVELERLCLSPQCGFASTEQGNALTEDEQWAKLGFVVGVANEVWGSA
jgi:5-methyltetrahydropteroyltriglutamate--homocysteine methyltransferase